ncbi:NAD(P)-dependent alcohol dehydrogenase [Chitinophaga nivalis]|uniref:NAD(P)-dependent alcohol dehydrogenase n=1 Tax=Chitinophaga nivalis TaxID=2991709 RepID=A0ABT3IQX5_9BACT|nr:NAD(P)-dependent alcohol dehydrogenase [Chitinophaga nivalis]MCW3463932.1 NAD(P)-dependent alcohol dehydrogenase [Chitinophaga nivalis]MCW3486378.1 NAD(P)-dependent alcohol dehydrogenase [Chitinophaga nivalis]
MDIQAAMLKAYNEPFSIETVTLGAPADEEILVRLVATGICHTDVAVQEGVYPFPVPAILGHEGAGIVTAVGKQVTSLQPGDQVVLSFLNCGACSSCATGHPAYCDQLFPLNLSGRRDDGTTPYQHGEETINGLFFHQSSFATHTITHFRNAVKVPQDVPLASLGPLGCSIQTGIGTILHTIKPDKGSSILICGVGPVGLAAVIGAHLAQCREIIAVDQHADRLDLAVELGATHTCLTTDQPLADYLREKWPNGVHHIVDTTGHPDIISQSFLSLLPRGILALLGLRTLDSQLTLPYFLLSMGRTVTGVLEGDCRPHEMIPKLVALYQAGQLPIDKMITQYPLADINRAVADLKAGKIIKAVILM